MKTSEEISPLLQKWRNQRASHINFSVARYGIFLTLIFIVADFIFNRNVLTVGGAFLAFLGSTATYVFSKRKEPPTWVWMPLYFGFWFAASTSLVDTGEINSPFIGSYMALLFVGGLVIQNQIPPLF